MGNKENGRQNMEEQREKGKHTRRERESMDREFRAHRKGSEQRAF